MDKGYTDKQMKDFLERRKKKTSKSDTKDSPKSEAEVREKKERLETYRLMTPPKGKEGLLAGIKDKLLSIAEKVRTASGKKKKKTIKLGISQVKKNIKGEY